MAAWQLNESRGLGGSEKVWKLSKEGEGLTVGRATYCDVQILSQSVEKKHSVIKWDQKKEGYVIHDLGSVNGTFLNDQPLLNGVATLCHGDVVRFGYDKGHLFSVKKVEQRLHLPPPPLSSALPHSFSPPPPPLLSTYSQMQTSPAHPLTPTQQVASVHYVSIPSVSPSLILPALQPYLLPQPFYSPHVPQIGGHVTGHMITTGTVGYVSPYASPSPVPTTPLHLLPHPHPPTSHPHDQPTTPTTDRSISPSSNRVPSTKSSQGSWTVESGGPSSSEGVLPPRSVSSRKDGRRSISLSSADMPRLSEVSRLYGRPSWWGEEGGGGGDPVVTKKDGDTPASSPRRPARRDEPQILRDVSPPASPSASPRPMAPVSASDSHRYEEGGGGKASSGSAWTFEAGAPRRSRALPPRWRRPVRSADSSPVRTHARKQRSVSPGSAGTTQASSSKNTTATTSSGRDFTPLSQRITARRAPASGSRPATTGRRGTTGTSSLKPQHTKPHGDGGNKREILQVVEHSAVQQAARTRDDTVCREGEEGSSHCYGREASGDLGSRSETVMTLKAEETFVVTSPPSDVEERSSSGRKQWNNNENSLMMASIEARMKRLDKLAQRTYLSLSAMEAELVGGTSGLTSSGGASISSPLSTVDTESRLPEWKFFNKEVDSIFKGIRSVEKWLKDIDTTVASLRVQSSKRQEQEGDGGREDRGERHVENELRQEHQVEGESCHLDVSLSSSEATGAEFHDSIEEDSQCTAAATSSD